MLKTRAKFKFEDKSRKHNFTGEVNWDEKDTDVNEGKIIKFTFPNGDISFVERKHLNEFLFMIGTPEEQQKMVPQRITTVRHHEGLFRVEAKKDIFKGQDFVFPYSVLCDNVKVEEIIGPVQDKSLLIPAKSKFI